MSRTITRTAWPVSEEGGEGIVVSLWVSWGIHSMHSLMQLVCHSVQLRQPQPASYLGRVLSASLSLSVAPTASTHILWPTVHHSYEQAAVSFSLSLFVSWHAGRHLSSFQAAQRIVVSYLCGLLLLFAIFYWSLFGQLTSTTTHTYTYTQ